MSETDRQIRELSAEIEEIERYLVSVCSNGQLLLVDLGYIAGRVRDIKESLRILQARKDLK